MHWMIEPFRRYADFSGRSRRVEFWSFILFQWLVYIGLIFAAIAVGALPEVLGDKPGGASDTAIGVGAIVAFGLIALFWLGTLIPNLAVAARRMQDQDIPGGIGIALVIGGILFSFPYLIMAVFGFIDGTRGDNRFGADPKRERHVGVIFD